jgi:hypothetical protein
MWTPVSGSPYQELPEVADTVLDGLYVPAAEVPLLAHPAPRITPASASALPPRRPIAMCNLE